MKIISSQHYINPAIVEAKMAELEGEESVSIPCVYAGEIDGEEYAVQIDGHHTLAAARELGIDVQYDINSPKTYGYCQAGEDLLEILWLDGDWYCVETSDPGSDMFDLVW